MYNLKTSCRTEPAKMIKGQVNETEQQCVDGLLFQVVSGAGYSIPQRYLKHMARLPVQLFPETVKIMLSKYTNCPLYQVWIQLSPVKIFFFGTCC